MKRRLFSLTMIAILSVLLGEAAYAQFVVGPMPEAVPTPTHGENLTRTAVSVSASDYDSESVGPWCVKDESFITQWECTPGYGQWLEIDLGRLCRSDRMVIVHPSIWSGNPLEDILSYEIEVRTRTGEDEDWELAFSVVNSGSEAYNILNFDPPRRLRYAKLTVGGPVKDAKISPTAKIVEWEIWGEALGALPPPEEYDANVDWVGPQLENNLSTVGEVDWEAIRQFGMEIMNDPTIDPYTRSRAMLELGFALLKIGGDVDPFEILEWVKGQTQYADNAAAAANRMANAWLTAGINYNKVYENLVWTMGMFPNTSSAMWARVELIEYYHRTGQPDKAAVMLNELLAKHEEGRATLGHVAWGRFRYIAVGEREEDAYCTPEQFADLQALWEEYKAGVAGASDEENEIVRDVAFRIKHRLFRHFYVQRTWRGASAELEEVLSWYPQKWAWSAAMRFFLADCYLRLHEYEKARGNLDIISTEFPDSSAARHVGAYRRLIDAWDSYRKMVVQRVKGGGCLDCKGGGR